MWLTILLDQLPVIALVGSYPTNKLIGDRPIRKRELAPAFFAEPSPCNIIAYYLVFRRAIHVLGVRYLSITHPFAAEPSPRVAPWVRLRTTCMCKARRQRSF